MDTALERTISREAKCLKRGSFVSFMAISLAFFKNAAQGCVREIEIPLMHTVKAEERLRPPSGRRRDHSRRPPTPQDVPFGIRRFMKQM
jgi:hypothetical protein